MDKSVTLIILACGLKGRYRLIGSIMNYTKNTKIKVILIQEEAECDVAEGCEPECHEDMEEFTWGELQSSRHPLFQYIIGDQMFNSLS